MISGNPRELFELPEDVAYLNCSYLSPNLRSVRAAGEAGVGRKSRPWEVRPADFFEESERARALFAALVGGDVDGVGIVPSVSYGVGIAAANVEVGTGDRIVVLEDQFPSNWYPWRHLADRVGAELVTVPRPRDDEWTPGVIDEIERGAAVVALGNCHWTDGSAVDLVAVGKAVRAAGAALVVDATQSAGAYPLSVADVQPDFLVVAAYKWMLGPYSLGFVYAAPHRRAGVPLEYNWITREHSEDFAGLVDYVEGFQPGARRYDVGERSNFALMPMAVAALDQILAWGVPAISDHVAALTDAVEQGARDLGLAPVPAAVRLPHIVGVRMPGGVPPELGERLAAAKVYVSVRGDSIRVSPHVYNDADDVARLFEVLATG